jgi:hypothetical protein
MSVIRQAPSFRCIKYVSRGHSSWGDRPPASTVIFPCLGVSDDTSRPPTCASTRSYRSQRSGARGRHTARPEAAPQEEAAGPAATTEATAAGAAPDAVAESPPAEPAAEETAATAEAATPEAAEVPEAAAPEAAEVASTTTLPAQEEETEVVLGRRLLPNLAETPLPRLFAKSQQTQEELEAGIRREWEKLEAECLRLSDWEHRLGDRIQTVSARYTRERAELVLGRELL